MKTSVSILLFMVWGSHTLMAQSKNQGCMPLLNESSPSFVAESTQGTIHFPEDYYGKWKILFSHPADFTPVCTSEILELAYMQDEFFKLKTALVVISTDRISSHIEWVKSIESIDYKDRNPVKIAFPLVSDPNLEVSMRYGMIHSYSSSSKDVRAVFIINPEDKISAIFYYPNNVGRNIEEIKRVLIALQTAERNNVLTPANWNPGDEVLIHAPATIEESAELKAKNNPDLRSFTWYMWFKKLGLNQRSPSSN
jgi:peroxiredoxin (alkyl hydroperoxide reductase subunit C)